MDISKGIYIKQNLLIAWDTSLQDFLNFCSANNIVYQQEELGLIKKISLSIKFANLDNAIANIYFTNNIINEVYITNFNNEKFSKERYLETKNRLISFLGKPKIKTSSKAVWKFKRIKIEHFYINRDGIETEYLVIKNGFAKKLAN